ncbi:hypothetical protein [Caldanaerobacter subterraneus]|uniref:Uncharacterized protein n=1 Tax=Caldanaerobacter subterraneus TaxID=911092 RepID=A0A7Y2L6W0_9THEO|nr:hypothetical protein [Caldanaerobacter subterraneus]NNG66420.1 hypothetical protein [Caldanaerobacter subterraneus]
MFTQLDDDDLIISYMSILDNLIMLKLLYDYGVNVENIWFDVTPEEYPYDYFSNFLYEVVDRVFGGYYSTEEIFVDENGQVTDEENSFSSLLEVTWTDPDIVAYIKKFKYDKEKIRKLEELLDAVIYAMSYITDTDVDFSAGVRTNIDDGKESVTFIVDNYYGTIPANADVIKAIFKVKDFCRKEVSN